MKQATAEARCDQFYPGSVLCTAAELRTVGGSASWKKTCAKNQFSWSADPCSLQLQIFGNGMVGIVDAVQTEKDHYPSYRLNNGNHFRVWWAEDGAFPRIGGGVGGVGGTGCGSGCQPVSATSSCLCNISVVASTPFEGSLLDVDDLPSASRIRNTLRVGGVNPNEVFASARPGALPTYTKCTSAACQMAVAADTELLGIYWYSADDGADGKQLDQRTVFEVASPHLGEPSLFLRNLRSTVVVGDASKGHSFRNPPHFMPLLGDMWINTDGFSDTFDVAIAQHEVEALIKHLFHHGNTAPFVAHRMIQRLVTSNPSPRYVKAVSTAFSTGAHAGVTYSGKYGCLAATVAAVLLDREARDTLLDVDPRAGRLREPLLKVLGLLRGLEYASNYGKEVFLGGLQNRIGQRAFYSPTVFNFYLPEFSPGDTAVGASQLVAPESQLATAPNLIGFANGVSSLLQYGLSNCGYGFGVAGVEWRSRCNNADLIRSTNDGVLRYLAEAVAKTPEEIVSEWADLFTPGRLDPATRTAAIEAYHRNILLGQQSGNTELYGSNVTAVRRVLMLLVLSSEFHATNWNGVAAVTRSGGGGGAGGGGGRPYKALVVIFMAGAADSFNMLVPHSGCDVTSGDLHAEYVEIRGNEGSYSANELLGIDAKNSVGAAWGGGASNNHLDAPQPCTRFGVHPSMPTLKTLYDQGDAAWIANMGALVEPCSKQEYVDKSVQLPPSLFAHNIMQRSAQNLHPQYSSADGVVGRMHSVMQERDNFVTASYSTAGNKKITDGGPAVPSVIDPTNGVTRFREVSSASLSADEYLEGVNANASRSVMADTFSSMFRASLASTERLGALLTDPRTDLSVDAYEEGDPRRFGTDSVGKQLRQVAKLIKMRDIESAERDAFVVTLGGFDTHNDAIEKLSERVGWIDAALGVFVDEMKNQSVWGDVAVVTISDFGRTLTSNGLGTDHAWGGNYWLAGGSVKGGRVLGKYPARLKEAHSDVNIGRGRILPTTPWEAMWSAVAEWYGVTPQDMSRVLPNHANFGDEQLFNKAQLFAD